MIRIAVLGDIGSGKSFFARQLKIPLFSADQVVQNLYDKNKKLFKKLKKIFPKKLNCFPIRKSQLVHIINEKPDNLKKIIKIIHPMVRKELYVFTKKNRNKKVVVLDIPLFLENKLNRDTDIIVFIETKPNKLLSKLRQRKNFNMKIFKLLKSLQIPPEKKKLKADFVVKNNFNSAKIKKVAKNLLDQIIL